MNKDFHCYATYCAAILAGYSHEESAVIGYSSQMVDLCTRTMLSKLHAPQSAATTQLQLELMDARTDIIGLQDITRIWASFHFLPGDLYAQPKQKCSKKYLNKYRLICNPNSELLEKMSDANVRTELDWQLYQLQRRYLNYQVNIGNRIIGMLTSGSPEEQLKAGELSKPKRLFQDLIDDLFSETGKTIVRDSNEIYFMQYGEKISPYMLSSGEKQLLVILLTALVQDNNYGVLFMDEPEISSHIEWQKRLISLIRQLNPNVQIVLCTHSPAIIMDGWLDAVTEIADITQ